jgi:hypothetical protein
MRLSHFSLEGLIGALVFLAGAHLLWRSRDVAVAWMREFVCILRGEFARKSDAGHVSPRTLGPAFPHRPRSGALILVGALALIVIGQILFILNLTY